MNNKNHLDNDRPECHTVIVARELNAWGIDIAAPNETRPPDDGIIEDVGGGYTFFLERKAQ